jgi:hypothetical protein
MTRWKFDADRKDPLTARRIPVTPPWPMWGYFAAFDKDSPQRPTEVEVRMIQSYIAMVRQGWEAAIKGAEMDQEPLDWFPGYNTLVLHKYARDDWAHRRPSWVTPPVYPPSPRGRRPQQKAMTLVQVMDYVCVDPRTGEVGEGWQKWKAERPEIFDQG